MASCTHNVASNRLIVATASIDIHDSLSYSYTRDKVAADDEKLHPQCNIQSIQKFNFAEYLIGSRIHFYNRRGENSNHQFSLTKNAFFHL